MLQPRDFLNAWQLFFAFALLFLGAIITGFTGQLDMVAPAVVAQPEGAPSMMPFLFITIACGAISGFHSLVSSGTTSKQIDNEQHALPIGFGSMLIEAFLAVIVIIACCAGIGMGYLSDSNELLVGVSAWQSHYASWGASSGLASKLQAVVVGSANMMSGIGISQSMGIVIMGVFIASFAGTTLDTSTRLQRYVISELCATWRFKVSGLQATFIAVLTGAILAFSSGFSGKGALQLWPLFGGLNQLLATIGLGLLTVYLFKTKPRFVFVSVCPFLFMVVMTLWAAMENQWAFLIQGLWLLAIVNLFVIVAVFFMVLFVFLECFRSQVKIFNRKII